MPVLDQFSFGQGFPASGKTQVRCRGIVRSGQEAEIAIAECDQMVREYKSAAEIIYADKIELAIRANAGQIGQNLVLEASEKGEDDE